MEKKSKTVIVMGGSFNPPTRAHLLLMETAMEAAGADTGLFVPVSDAYLKRKLKNDGTRRICFQFALRAQLLEAMCEGDGRLQVCTADRERPVSDFYRLLLELQAQFPAANLYYTAGADKLPLLERVLGKTDFTDRFGLLIFCRGDTQIQTLLAGYPVLSAHESAFLFPDTPDAALGISATEVRRRILAGEPADDLLHPAVRERLRTVSVEDFPEEIAGFLGEYAFLDNRYPSPLTIDGETYLCAEAAFHASKTDDPNRRAAFRSYSGEKAREKGAALPVTKQWETQKVEVMRRILDAKFRQDPALGKKLLATDPAVLLNLANNSAFWGVDRYTRAGENMLGRLLMELRDKLKGEL